ncbi:50S ribosomal protein L11 methyltransferase, partial [Bacteroidota bacterium]
LNGVEDIEILIGDAGLLGPKKFNTVMANINRNVLLEDIPKYVEVLNPKGQLFVSGFYTQDLDMIKDVALSAGLTFKGNLVKDNWVSAHFTK